jgi:hypothetical protein
VAVNRKLKVGMACKGDETEAVTLSRRNTDDGEGRGRATTITAETVYEGGVRIGESACKRKSRFVVPVTQSDHGAL